MICSFSLGAGVVIAIYPQPTGAGMAGAMYLRQRKL